MGWGNGPLSRDTRSAAIAALELTRASMKRPQRGGELGPSFIGCLRRGIRQ
jgi:hypothetical protein